MKFFDFLSLSPTLYLLKEKRGKNKLGGFFSIIFVLLMASLTIYYFYIYSSGLDYDLTYFREYRTSYMELEQIKSIFSKNFYFGIYENNNKAKIKPIIIYDVNKTKPAEKCEFNPKPEYFPNDVYCFNLNYRSFDTLYNEGNHFLSLTCEENCTDKNGEGAIIKFIIASDELKIDHSNIINPFVESKELEGYSISFKIDYNTNRNDIKYMYITRMYNTTKIFSLKKETYINTYFDSLEIDYSYDYFEGFAKFSYELANDCDVYTREYRTLLDTLSKIGGLFSLFLLFFEALVYCYSELEINSEITKNVFSLIKKYEYKKNNKITIDNINNNINNIDLEISKEEKEKIELRKKFNIIKCEQYFCSFFNFCCDCCHFCKTHRTMKILNLCNDFIKTYLSPENIIFNIILFENYYKDNPIKYNDNSYLNNIEKEIENKNTEKNNLLMPLNSEEE